MKKPKQWDPGWSISYNVSPPVRSLPPIFPRFATGSKIMIGKHTYMVHFLNGTRIYEFTHITNPYMSRTKTEQEVADMIKKNITAAQIDYWLATNKITPERAENLKKNVIVVLDDGLGELG